MMRFISTAAEEAACKVARQFVSGIITSRALAMPRARGYAQLIKSAPYGRPAAKRIRIFQVAEETSRELLIGRGRCSMLARSYFSRNETRVRSPSRLPRYTQRCKLCLAKEKSKRCEIESVILTRCC